MTHRAEIHVLLCCVGRTGASGCAEEVRRLMQPDLDWSFLLAEAQRQAVLPLLYRGLHANFQQQTPGPVLDTLRAAVQHLQQRSLALTAELLRVLRILEKAEVPALPFKGPVLAALAYGDISMRTFGDLDILLHESDLSRARDALAAAGYASEFTFSAREERAYRKAECALQLRNEPRDTVLELHWLLTERYLSIDLPLAGFWERTATTALCGQSVASFALEDLVLYLCVHGSKHRWDRLEWLCSIAALIETQPGIDWRKVQHAARESGIERLLHLALLLARELLSVDPPEQVRDAIAKDRGAQKLVPEIAAQMFQSSAREGNRGSWYLYLLRIRERWQDRARIVLFSWVRLPHPSSREVAELPDRLSFLYYFFRPARLFGASIAAAWRYCVRERKTRSICTR